MQCHKILYRSVVPTSKGVRKDLSVCKMRLFTVSSLSPLRVGVVSDMSLPAADHHGGWQC